MSKSRQEIAFDQWKQDFTKLVLADKKLSPDTRRDIQAGIDDWASFPGIHENMIQAFSNFMWGMDAEIERQVNNEMVRLREIIPLLADPEDTNTLTIIDALNKIVAENSKPTVDLEDEAIDTLITDEEVDDSPIPGVK